MGLPYFISRPDDGSVITYCRIYHYCSAAVIGGGSLGEALLLPSLLLPLARLVHGEGLVFGALAGPLAHRLLVDVVEAEAAELALAPLLDDPGGGEVAGGPAALLQLAGAEGDAVEPLGGVVGRGRVVGVEGRVAQVEAVEQVVGEGLGGDDAVLDAADEGELEHGGHVADVGDEDAGGVEDVDALLDAALGVLVGDAHGRRHLARHARHRARLGRLGLARADADAPHGVEQRALAGVGHADHEGAQARQRVRARGALLDQLQEVRDGLGLAVVGEEDMGAAHAGLLLLLLQEAAPGFPPGVVFPEQSLLLLLEALGGLVKGQVGLCVDDDAVAAGEGGLEEGVGRGQGHAAVAALDDEGDVGQDALHGGQGAAVVAQEVGAHDGRGDVKGLARDELGRGRGGRRRSRRRHC